LEKPELSNADRDRIRKSAQIKVRLEAVLQSIIPEVAEDEVDSLSHDLADLWDIGQQHAKRIDRVVQLKGLDGRRELDEILSDLLYGDITELEYHIESLKKTLPKIIERLTSET
jgi:hypothetical protein